MPVTSWADHMARERNAGLTRTDIEWAVNDAGELYLRDKASFMAANTRAIAARQEAERNRWKARQDHPDAA